MTDFQIGFVTTLLPDGDEPPEEVDPDFLQGQIDALSWLLAGFMWGAYRTPQDRQRNARKIEDALLNLQLVADLESTYGPKFVRGFRQIIRRSIGFLDPTSGSSQSDGSSPRILLLIPRLFAGQFLRVASIHRHFLLGHSSTQFPS